MPLYCTSLTFDKIIQYMYNYVLINSMFIHIVALLVYNQVSLSYTKRTSMEPKWGLASLLGHTLLYTRWIVCKKWMLVEMQQIACLLHCTALYFLRQVFANCWSSLGLQLSLMIQNQSNYQHSRCTYTFCHVYRNIREGKSRFGAVLECSVHDCET